MRVKRYRVSRELSAWLFVWLLLAWLWALPASAVIGMVHPEPDATPPTIVIPEPQSLILAKVIRIFDADTVLVQIGESKRRYQLLGANAPEFNPKDRTPKPFAVESRRFIEQLLLGEAVYIQHDPRSAGDPLGRRRAYIFRAPDMLFVNLELVRQGYAKYDPNLGSLYNDAFHYYESKAKSIDRGIWNPDAPVINWAHPSDALVADPESPTKSIQPPTPSKPDAAPLSTPLPHALPPIFITKSGSKYHKEGCSHLTSTQRSTTREEVKGTHKPCKSCKPDG